MLLVAGALGRRVRRSAFSTTVSELMDIPTAAHTGVIQPRAANGNMRPLYSPAHSILFDDQDPNHTAAVDEASGHPAKPDDKAPPHA